jgi:hypothetical protein
MLLRPFYRWATLAAGLLKAIILSDHIRLCSKGTVAFDANQVVAVALGPERSSQEDPKIQLLQELVAGELAPTASITLCAMRFIPGGRRSVRSYRLLNTDCH